MSKPKKNKSDSSGPVNKNTFAPKEGSPWVPFQYKYFRVIWIATVVSNIGTWMHDVGAAWLMTTLTSDPLMVAMIQAATAFPIFLFALPAGALADIVDRRRYLLMVQLVMAIVAVSFALLVWIGLVTSWTLVAITFILGCGAAFSAPAWQAITPELVPPAELGSAVAINSIGINVARAIGPALGGILIAWYGPVLTFALNALTFTGIIWILFRWQREPVVTTLPAERFFSAIRAGVAYTRHSKSIQVVMLRAFAFFLFASAIWALLPLIAKSVLNQGAGGFGMLLSAIGLGAVFGATQLSRLQKYLSGDRLVMVASVTIALAAFALAFAQHLAVALAVMFLMGMAWIVVLSTLNVAAQKAAASWVRARVLSVYLVVFFGSMAFGSGVWGQLAKVLSITDALLIASVGQILGILVTARFHLQESEGIDNAPSGDWPAPLVDKEPEADQGPVLITIEYNIDLEKKDQFIQLMRDLQHIRKRDGAFFWSVFADVANPNRIIETFMTESWLQHLRQHEHTTNADHILQEDIVKVSIAQQSPVVCHYVSIF